MGGSLDIPLSLFRRQKAQIAQALEPPSAAFKRYEARYRRQVATYRRPLDAAQIRRQLQRSDVVYVGDYHTLAYAQKSFLSWVQVALEDARPLVLALEFVEGRHQETLDAYLRGRLGERAFLRRLGYSGRFDLWAHFRPIFELARAHRLRVAAIDLRARGARALKTRDEFAAQKISDCLKAPDRPRVMVLMGQYHVARCHLPTEVDRLSPGHPSLILYQNCDTLYWKLLKQRRIHRTEAVELRPGEICLFNASPLLCQQSFLDYLEAESPDFSLGADAEQQLDELVRMISRFLGMKKPPAPPPCRLLTVNELDRLSEMKKRGAFPAAQWASLKRSIVSGQSFYHPATRTVFLATRLVHHAAEQATQRVHHACIGEAKERPRGAFDDFYVRCIEEALGFFGSKLVNAHRTCPSLAQWVSDYQRAKGARRTVAGFLLAHKAAERDRNLRTEKLLPRGRGPVLAEVTRGLGYLLGEAMYGALQDGRLGPRELHALFHDALQAPQKTYFHWVLKVRA